MIRVKVHVNFTCLVLKVPGLDMFYCVCYHPFLAPLQSYLSILFSNIILDTPGQIEVFTWSASGSIITESLASTFPTIIVYVMDTPRSTNPITFMSNMLYACSIMYKTKLPFIVALNKASMI